MPRKGGVGVASPMPGSVDCLLSKSAEGGFLLGCGSKPMVPFWGRCTTHFSLFQWGLGCSPGVRDFDPWPLITET